MTWRRCEQCMVHPRICEIPTACLINDARVHHSAGQQGTCFTLSQNTVRVDPPPECAMPLRLALTHKTGCAGWRPSSQSWEAGGLCQTPHFACGCLAQPMLPCQALFCGQEFLWYCRIPAACGGLCRTSLRRCRQSHSASRAREQWLPGRRCYCASPCSTHCCWLVPSHLAEVGTVCVDKHLGKQPSAHASCPSSMQTVTAA